MVRLGLRTLVGIVTVATALVLIIALLGSRDAGVPASASPTLTNTASASPSMSVVASPSTSPTPATAATYRLTVSVLGASNGHVLSIPAGIDCPGICSARFPAGAIVTLQPYTTESPAHEGIPTETKASRWSGDCAGLSCKITMSKPRAASITFRTEELQALQIINATIDRGRVVSDPGGIDCGGGGTTCLAWFSVGTRVTLTATGINGYSFLGFDSACIGTPGLCTITIEKATVPRQVQAFFNGGE